MGMFDDVVCELPLPDGWAPREGKLQSRDFACDLDTYTITKAGRLTRRYVSDREPVPESEWQYVGATDALEQIWHEQSKWKNVYSECDMNFHGMLNFYSVSGDHAAGTFEWHEYNAKFTDGQLVSIECKAEADE